MQKCWTDSAWQDYLRLRTENPVYFNELNLIIEYIEYQGTENAEPFGNLKHYFSVKVDEENCLVFKFDSKADEMIIQAVKNHIEG